MENKFLLLGSRSAPISQTSEQEDTFIERQQLFNRLMPARQTLFILITVGY